METATDFYELNERELMGIDGGLNGEDVCMLVGSAVGASVGGSVGSVVGALAGAAVHHVATSTDPLDTHLASL